MYFKKTAGILALAVLAAMVGVGWSEQLDEINVNLDSAKLVLKTQSGQIQTLPAAASAAATTTTIGTTGTAANAGSSVDKRAKNKNKKSHNKHSQRKIPAINQSEQEVQADDKLPENRGHGGAGKNRRTIKHQHQQHNNNNNSNDEHHRRELKLQQNLNKRSKSKNNNKQHQQQQQQADAADKEKQKSNGNAEKSPASTCRYSKSAWSDCDGKTNIRTRTLTLKKGGANCPLNRTIEKKCKEPCRYTKGTWSACVNDEISREDKLKLNGSGNPPAGCEPTRTVTGPCNKARKANGAGKAEGKKERKHKDKVARRAAE